MNELKNQRQKHNLTQKEVAKKIGISCSMLTKLENNERFASKETMEKLSNFYQVSVDRLFFGDYNH